MKHRGLILCLLCSLAPALHASADVPPGRYTIGDGTVYDTRTKLTWQRTIDNNAYAQANAVSYCAALSLAGGGWRLPRVSELLTILDRTRFNPPIDSTAFPNTPWVYFWTSSAYADTPNGYAWIILFTGGGSQSMEPVTNERFVRCVR